MKTENKEKTEKSEITQLREIRDQMSLEIQDLSFEQLKEYLLKKDTLRPDLWRKLS